MMLSLTLEIIQSTITRITVKKMCIEQGRPWTTLYVILTRSTFFVNGKVNGNHGIDLAGHDGGTRLQGREFDLPETAYFVADIILDFDRNIC